MKTARDLATVLLATGSLILIACAHHPSASAPAFPGSRPDTGVTEAQNQADTRVVDQIATARCDHEAKCGNIGAGKKYERRELCTDEMRGKTAPDLTAYKCPLGIDRPQLDACFKQLREQSCSFSLTHLFSANDCSESALCIK
jgi:hypothetical protein